MKKVIWAMVDKSGDIYIRDTKKQALEDADVYDSYMQPFNGPHKVGKYVLEKIIKRT